LDAIKDNELLNVTIDRDRIAAEKTEAMRKLRKLKIDYKSLQEEVNVSNHVNM
jgi:hypothetical protein